MVTTNGLNTSSKIPPKKGKKMNTIFATYNKLLATFLLNGIMKIGHLDLFFNAKAAADLTNRIAASSSTCIQCPNSSDFVQHLPDYKYT